MSHNRLRPLFDPSSSFRSADDGTRNDSFAHVATNVDQEPCNEAETYPFSQNHQKGHEFSFRFSRDPEEEGPTPNARSRSEGLQAPRNDPGAPFMTFLYDLATGNIRGSGDRVFGHNLENNLMLAFQTFTQAGSPLHITVRPG
jgi:hypothetical protein